MRNALFATLLLLSACAAPEPVFKPVSVEVPVAVPCKAPAVPKPASALRQAVLTAPLFDKVKAALVEIDVRKAYEARLEAALAACR
jgi:hypothetical protein